MKKISFMHQASIGDMLMVTPTYRAVKECFPECETVVITSHAGYEMMFGNPFIDRLIVYRKGDPFLPIIKNIWRSDVAVIFDYHYRNALYAMLAMIPKRIGHGKDWINIHLEDEPLDLFEPLKYLAAVAPLGIHTDDITLTRPIANADDRAHVDELIRSICPREEKLVIIVPFSLSTLKDWATENYRELIRRLKAKGNVIAILGGREQRNRAAEEFPDAINLCGSTNLRESAEIISRARLYISGCTAMLHVCSTTDTPSIALYGPTLPEQWAPKKNCTVIYHKQACAPCYGLDRPPCADNKCMKSITVEEVWAVAEKIIEQKK